MFSTGNVSMRYEEIIRFINNVFPPEEREKQLDHAITSVEQQLYGLKSAIADKNRFMVSHTVREEMMVVDSEIEITSLGTTKEERLINDEDRESLQARIVYLEKVLRELEARKEAFKPRIQQVQLAKLLVYWKDYGGIPPVHRVLCYTIDDLRISYTSTVCKLLRSAVPMHTKSKNPNEGLRRQYMEHLEKFNDENREEIEELKKLNEMFGAYVFECLDAYLIRKKQENNFL
jgi:hypothetical protein